jgi:aryl sulfotransferase
MSAIVWLASYPKSGNTWVRLLLANYMSEADEPVDINQLAVSAMASARRPFDDWCGVEASALDDSTVKRLRPAVYRHMAAEATEDLFMKVHDAWSDNGSGQPMFPPEVTRAVVYIVRNPLDVVVSAASHWHLEPEEMVARMCDPHYRAAVVGESLPDQLQHLLGSWGGHARSWLDRSGLPGQVVRYEDLRDDPEHALRGMLATCGLACDDRRVRIAVEFSDFTELQRQERAQGFRERPVGARDAFFRRGEVGAWRDELPGPLVTRLTRAHGEMMARFGYLEEAA